MSLMSAILFGRGRLATWLSILWGAAAASRGRAALGDLAECWGWLLSSPLNERFWRCGCGANE